MDPLFRRPSISSEISSNSAQAGVRRLEAVSASWSKWSLYLAYAGLYSMAYATSLEGQTTTNLTVFATSAFNAHTLVSTVTVVQGVALSVVKPPMSKIADVFGRFEAFVVCVILLTIGYIQQAGANNVKTYGAAQIFYSAGATGLQILQQIFIADTSDSLNRALCATIPDLPFLVNVWIGAPLANYILENSNWRWGYGIWAIILPVAFMPSACSLWISQRKAARRGLLPEAPYAGKSFRYILRDLWYEMDFFGLVLLSAAISLILIPLTLAARAHGAWANPSILGMLVVGGISLVAFPVWESSERLAPHAFFPKHLLRKRTVLAGVAIAFFYFMAFYLSVFPYFYSYSSVVQNQSVTAAGHITQTFTFTSTVTSIIISFLIKYTKRYKYLVTTGCCIYLAGIALMIKYRTEDASTASLVACQVLVGIGGAMIHVPAQSGVQASASHSEVGTATAMFLTLLEVGGAVGSAISGAIWSSYIPPKSQEYLPPETADQASAIFGNITLAARGWPMGSPTRSAINRAYQETMTKILTVAVCVCLPSIPLSLLMTNYKLDEIDQHVKGTVIGGHRHDASPEEREPLDPFAHSSRSDDYFNDLEDSRSRPDVYHKHS